jgi:hypothetical protein
VATALFSSELSRMKFPLVLTMFSSTMMRAMIWMYRLENTSPGGLVVPRDDRAVHLLLVATCGNGVTVSDAPNGASEALVYAERSRDSGPTSRNVQAFRKPSLRG